jgi:hypothetical protein
MIDLKKTTPVYEMEKKMIEQKFIVGKLDSLGNFETSEKMMFDFMNEIYESGKKSAKKKPWLLISVLTIVGVIIGGISTALIMLQYIKK